MKNKMMILGMISLLITSNVFSAENSNVGPDCRTLKAELVRKEKGDINSADQEKKAEEKDLRQ